MNIEYIIVLLEKKLSNLFTLKTMIINSGDIEALIRLDNEILETEESLRRIKNIN